MVIEAQTYRIYQREYADTDSLCTDEIGNKYIRVKAKSYSEIIEKHPRAERVELPEKNVIWYSTLKSQKSKTFDNLFFDILPDIKECLKKHNIDYSKDIAGDIQEKMRNRYVAISHSNVKHSTVLQTFVEEYIRLLPKEKYTLHIFTSPSKASVEINGFVKQSVPEGIKFILLAGQEYKIIVYKKGYFLTEKNVVLNADGRTNVSLKPEPYSEKKRLFGQLVKKNYIIRLQKDGVVNVLNLPASNDINLFRELHKAIDNLHTYKISYRIKKGD